MLSDVADWGDRIKTTLGFVLHLVLLPFVLASGLVVPIGVVVALTVAWGALLVLILQRRSDEDQVLAAPIVMVALLVIVPTLGSALFDWTA
jgi:hypothetical protein